MLSKSIRSSLLALILLVPALVLGSCSTNPATGKSQLAMISEAQEIEMGRQADREIVASMGLYPDEELQRYVQELGLRLARSSERPNLPWQFRVLDDPTVNAFALPGGFLYVTRGILAHLSSEAELVGVLGHEIGHVTARHSVEQMSRAQLATLGLGVAAIASDSQDVARYGQLVQAGVGLMFLKFGRDDERQADDLGLRYLTRAAYDPREMPNVFRTLDRVSAAAGAGRIPNWLATHPSPADRVQRLSAAIATLPPEVQQGTINHEPYLERLAGLVYGNDPREGFFEGRAFYHPGMAFELALPAGWTYRNEKRAVIAVAPNQDAAVVLTLAGAESPQVAAQKFFSQQGIERGNEWQRRLFFNFRTLPPEQQPDARTVRGIVGFFDHQQTVFELRGLTTSERWGDYRGAIEAALGSFRRLTDRRYLEVEPARLEVVRLSSPMSFEEFLRRYPSSAEAAAVATLNGVEPGQSLAAGRLMKRVRSGAR